MEKPSLQALLLLMLIYLPFANYHLQFYKVVTIFSITEKNHLLCYNFGSNQQRIVYYPTTLYSQNKTIFFIITFHEFFKKTS